MKCHFKLVEKLDLTGLHFYPIGDPDYPYGGVFNGNAHTITHLMITGQDYVSLFGQLASGAEVKDLGVVDVNITGSGWDVGGLVGWGSGDVAQYYSAGVVSGDSSVGGLVGGNGGTVTHCYSTGSVNGSGDWTIGGLVGYSEWQGHRTVTHSFWDIWTSGRATSAGGTGKTTAEMQTAATFLNAGWDFVGETANGTEDIWWILEGKDYPRLWWERSEE
jgi:hypothetical protein